MNKYSLIKNKLNCESSFPNIEYQGGDLFYDDISSTHMKIIGKGEKKVLIKNSVLAGHIYNSIKYENFSLVNCYNILLLQGVSVNIEYPGESVQTLFKISTCLPSDSPPSSGPLSRPFSANAEKGQNKGPLLNRDDKILLNNCNISSVRETELSNINNITIINTSFKNVKTNFKTEKIKIIRDDYVITDRDGNMFHIEDTSKDITITIPDNLDVNNKEFYFRKMNERSNTKIFIKTQKLHKTENGILILDRQHLSATLYNYEDTFYLK